MPVLFYSVVVVAEARRVLITIHKTASHRKYARSVLFYCGGGGEESFDHFSSQRKKKMNAVAYVNL